MALAFTQQLDNNTEFAVWRIEEEADDLYHQLQLDEQEKAYVQTLSSGKRHLHWLGTRVLLRRMLRTDDYINCQVDAYGKPYLVNLPYHISLSHSFDYAAVMISKTEPVGIDIEQIKEKVERIATKFLSPQELAFIEPEQRIPHLYACWCAKEAIYKCHGRKEVSFLDHIRLQPFTFNGQGHIQATLQKGALDLQYQVQYLQFENYMIGYVKGATNEK
ncbi:4'-phosphopantetheinyl transferase superfamily protein [Mucilaginibacter koreensis]